MFGRALTPSVNDTIQGVCATAINVIPICANQIHSIKTIA